MSDARRINADLSPAPAGQKIRDHRPTGRGLKHRLKTALVAHLLAGISRGRLEYRLLTALKAGGTYAMRRLSALVIWTYDVQQGSRSKLTKFVTSCFLFPLVVISDLGFELTYNLGQLLILGSGSGDLIRHFQNQGRQPLDLLTDFSILGAIRNGLSEFHCLFQQADSGGNLSQNHTDDPFFDLDTKLMLMELRHTMNTLNVAVDRINKQTKGELATAHQLLHRLRQQRT